jgi:hypothetical protein
MVLDSKVTKTTSSVTWKSVTAVYCDKVAGENRRKPSHACHAKKAASGTSYR